MSQSVTQVESAKFSLFQKELHWSLSTHDDKSKPPTAKDRTHNTYQHNFKKISWYIPEKIILPGTKTDGYVTYTADNSYDYLIKTFLTVMLPALKVKQDKANAYRICWTHNVGINIVQEAKLLAGDIPLYSFDSITHDILSQYGYLVKAGFKKHHLASIGAIPKLERWSNSLPAHQLDILQPYFYAKAQHLALPLLQSSITQFRHNYKFRLRILSLLRMQKYCNKLDKWVTIRPVYGVIDGIKDKDSSLAQPTLWGRYAKVTPLQLDYYRNCGSGDKKSSLVHYFYYDDFVAIKDNNKKSYGEVADIALSSTTPVKAVFWVAQNISAKKYNNYSNYTTNEENVNNGWNPTKKYNITYPRTRDDLPISQADTQEAWQFPRAPWDPGYNAHTFCNNPFAIDGEPSANFVQDKVKLLISLGNTDPNLITPENYDKNGVVSTDDDDISDNEPDSEDESEPSTATTATRGTKKRSSQFLIQVRLLVYRKLSYHYDKDKGGFLFKRDDLDSNAIWFNDEYERYKSSTQKKS
jgi:hypothetical protein